MDKKGTGETIAELELGELGTLFIDDDGDNDYFTDLYLLDDNGNKVQHIRWALRDFREDYSDEKLKKAIEGDQQPDPYTRPKDDNDVVDRRVAFSCSDCNRTWPGTRNQNPGGGDDICPECHN